MKKNQSRRGNLCIYPLSFTKWHGFLRVEQCVYISAYGGTSQVVAEFKPKYEEKAENQTSRCATNHLLH